MQPLLQNLVRNINIPGSCRMQWQEEVLCSFGNVVCRCGLCWAGLKPLLLAIPKYCIRFAGLLFALVRAMAPRLPFNRRFLKKTIVRYFSCLADLASLSPCALALRSCVGAPLVRAVLCGIVFVGACDRAEILAAPSLYHRAACWQRLSDVRRYGHAVL